MKKKFLSGLLAGMMLMTSMSALALADETKEDGIYVGMTKYETIAAAQSAAVNQNLPITISGTVEFGYRQGISADGIMLQGENNATIVTSDAFASASETSRKAILSTEASNVTIKDITFDGGTYGSTLVPDSSTGTEFNVLRINSGSAALENVTIKNSNRTLLSVGTSSTEATVTANGLYCDAVYKTMDTPYADVNVVNGTLTLNSGQVNGLICTDAGLDFPYFYSGSFVNTTSNHFKLGVAGILGLTQYITSTAEHLIESYINAKDAISQTEAEKYADAIADTDNQTEVEKMVTYVDENGTDALKNDFVELLNDAKTLNPSATGVINEYISTLEGTE